MTTNARKVITTFRNKTARIDGWFEDIDCLLFHVLLSFHSSNSIQGDLLEIGVYQGKSAILLGMHLGNGEKLHACDIFDNHTDAANKIEIVNSYPQLSLGLFLENYSKVIVTTPEVYCCASNELGKLLPDIKFRFIHIDGSHLYEHVSRDLALAAEVIHQQQGIIVLDDFRAEHAIGVSSAMWEMVYFHGLRPIIFTSSKAYLVPASSNLTMESLMEVLKANSLNSEVVCIKDLDCLRVHNLSRPLHKSRREILKQFIPPILIQLVRVIKNKNIS